MQEIDECINQQIALLPPHVIPAITGPSGHGKRIRALTVLLCGLISGKMNPALVPVAAACELFHLATLIHDDLVDEHQVRRGYPTLYKKISPAAAVLIADFIFARSYALFLESKSNAIIEIITETLAQITAAELQVYTNDTGRSFLLEKYLIWISDKTASLFRACAACGALLGEVDENGCDHLTRYGELLGISFQIQDDILDYKIETGDARPIGSDLKSGMVTLPLICHNSFDKKTPAFISWLQGSRDKDTIYTLIREVQQSGALQASMDQAVMYAQKAADIAAAHSDGLIRDALINLCWYSVNRNR